MKKIILFLTITTIILSCSSDSNSNSNNPSNGNVNYYFKIKINGVEHKVQGNTSGFLNGDNPNNCYASVGTTTQLLFRIADITRPNYISGQTLQIWLQIPNCQVGLNQADVIIQSSPVTTEFIQSTGSDGLGFVENSGLYCNMPSNFCQYPQWSSYINKININITDMGTPNGPQGYGNTFKGNYNGIVYYGTNSSGGGAPAIHNMNIPMQFSMEFEAYR